MMNFRTIQILTVFLLVCEIQGFDPNYTETCKCKCHGDVCELDHYCDQSTKKCTHCRFRFGDCFTPACEPCCESFCKIVKSCPMPKQPEHGEYIWSNGQKIQPGTKLEVNCSYGYYNTGVRYTTCRSGRWSHLEPDVSQPFCKQITCIIPQPPAHCRVEFPQNVRQLGLDSKIYFKCENGYVLRGNSYCTCIPNGTYGKWKGTLPECVEIVCKSPPAPTNGGIRTPPGLARFVNGTWITFTCNDGFYLKGDTERQCLPNGSWSFHSATCAAKEPSTDSGEIADRVMIVVCFLYVLYLECRKLYKWVCSKVHGRDSKECRKIAGTNDTKQPKSDNEYRVEISEITASEHEMQDVHQTQGVTDDQANHRITTPMQETDQAQEISLDLNWRLHRYNQDPFSFVNP